MKFGVGIIFHTGSCLIIQLYLLVGTNSTRMSESFCDVPAFLVFTWVCSYSCCHICSILTLLFTLLRGLDIYYSTLQHMLSKFCLFCILLTWVIFLLAHIVWKHSTVLLFFSTQFIVHCVSKNDNDVLRYNFNAHQSILIIFGRDIAE